MGLVCLVACALGAGAPVAFAARDRRAARAPASSTAQAAARNPDIGCTLDLRQRPHLSATGRRAGKSEVTWKVTVACHWGRIVGGEFVSSGVRAAVELIHVRMALYRNGKQVGQAAVDKPVASYLRVAVAGPCTARAIYQGWAKGVAVLPPGVRDYRNGTSFSINQGWGHHRRVARCS